MTGKRKSRRVFRQIRILVLLAVLLLLAAARSGLGIVMWSGGANLGEDMLQRGELILAHAFHALSRPETYCLVYPRELAEEPLVEGFREGLRRAGVGPGGAGPSFCGAIGELL